jgi:hypothetical protein
MTASAKPSLLANSILSISPLPSVYVCMYVCMYVCLYVCIHACLMGEFHFVVPPQCRVCMYVCMYVCLYVCMDLTYTGQTAFTISIRNVPSSISFTMLTKPHNAYAYKPRHINTHLQHKGIHMYT